MISSEEVEKKSDNILNTGTRTLFRNSNIYTESFKEFKLMSIGLE
jgi:hypothetical protein